MNELILSNEQGAVLWDHCNKLAKSVLVPQLFQKRPEDIYVAILYGRELGLSPIMSLTSIVVIQGQATMKVQTMNAVVRKNCKEAVISVKTDHEKRQVHVIAKRNAQDEGYTSFWDMERASTMGLARKDNWLKQPMAMLNARALSEALRMVFADVLMGFYSTEEMEDLPPIKQAATPEEKFVEIANNCLSKESLEEQFPIPEEEKAVGPLYRIQNGKFRSKQLKDLTIDEIQEYAEDMEKRKTQKPWEKDLAWTMRTYLTSIADFNPEP